MTTSATRRGAQAAVMDALTRLNNALLAANTATQALEAWCAAARPGAPIVARRIEDATPVIDSALRQRLQAGADEPVAYRHIEMVCADEVLSEARNWYLPARLTPAMRTELEIDGAPFGRVILPLGPVRETTSVTRFWPTAGAAEDIPDQLFEHRARVLDAHGRPLAEVVEIYTRQAVLLGL
jgi:hypothetical protein